MEAERLDVPKGTAIAGGDEGDIIRSQDGEHAADVVCLARVEPFPDASAHLLLIAGQPGDAQRVSGSDKPALLTTVLIDPDLVDREKASKFRLRLGGSQGVRPRAYVFVDEFGYLSEVGESDERPRGIALDVMLD